MSEPVDLVVTFDFVCFDAENRRAGDAEIVQGVSPEHACQEYVASLEAANNEIGRRPYIIAVRPRFRENASWDLWQVQPTVVVSYPVSKVSEADVARVSALQAQPALPPIHMRPAQHRAPDGHSVSEAAIAFAEATANNLADPRLSQPPPRDPADDILGLSAPMTKDPSHYQ